MVGGEGGDDRGHSPPSNYAKRASDQLAPWHPFKALFTATRISSTVTWPVPFGTPAEQSLVGVLPSAMFTSVRISSTVTFPSPLQSPTQRIGVGLGVAVSPGGGELVAVATMVGVLVGTGGVMVGVFTKGVAVRVSVG